VLSVLRSSPDALRSRVEKTYSAPFATHLYSKEPSSCPTAATVRDYPRLEHGGAHLDDPAGQRSGRHAACATCAVLRGHGAGLLLLLAAAGSPGVARLRRQVVARLAGLSGEIPSPRRSPDHLLGVMLALAGSGSCRGYYHVLGTDKVGQDVLYQASRASVPAWSSAP
jgi:peptide/nickel transport system permease protein